MQITPDTKIHDLLTTYPELEEYLIKLNSKYKKLKNPVLRRTIGRVATLKQVAMVGGYHPLDLVNMIRHQLNMPPITIGDIEEAIDDSNDKPHWLDKEPSVILDANKLLDSDKNPLAESNKALNRMSDGEVLLIKSDFLPSPLIDSFKEKGKEVYSIKEGEKSFLTYIKK